MVTQSFEYFVDLQTDTQKVQVVKITCGGSQVKQRLKPFFAAYKHYRLGSVSVRFVPAATLPVDPTGLSYEAGESTVDPRDQFNPGLVRITNGEDFYELNDTESEATDAMDSYYAMLLDRRWFKFQLQQGMRRTARPLFWDVGQVHQDQFPGYIINAPWSNGGNQASVVGVDWLTADGTGNTGEGSSPLGLFQTGLKRPMGWLPTDACQQVLNGDASAFDDKFGLASVPEVELMRIVLPKAFKTKFYYRLYIRESVSFKDPVVIDPFAYATNIQGSVNAPLDRFIRINLTGVSPLAGFATNSSLGFDNNGQGDE